MLLATPVSQGAAGGSHCLLRGIPGSVGGGLDPGGVIMWVSFFLCHKLGAYRCHGAARGD